jgi:hypothetical protein
MVTVKKAFQNPVQWRCWVQLDFGVISRDALLQEFIPKVEKIVPSYALVLNDFAVTAAPIVMRCSFSKQLLSVPHKDAVILSCGNILSSQSFKLLKQKGSLTPFQEPGDIVVRCPFCVRSVRADGRMHWVKCDKLGIISDFYSYYHMDQEYDDEEARPTPKDFHGLKRSSLLGHFLIVNLRGWGGVSRWRWRRKRNFWEEKQTLSRR